MSVIERETIRSQSVSMSDSGPATLNARQVTVKSSGLAVRATPRESSTVRGMRNRTDTPSRHRVLKPEAMTVPDTKSWGKARSSSVRTLAGMVELICASNMG